MSRLYRSRLACVIAILMASIIALIFVGGVVVDNVSTYYPEGGAHFENIEFVFDVDSNSRNIGCPGLIIYSHDQLPYDLSITVNSPDLSLNLKSLHISTIDFKYSNDTHFRTAAVDAYALFCPVMRPGRSRDLETGDVVFFHTPAARVKLDFPNLLSNGRSVTLRLKGFLFFDDNTSKGFALDKELILRDKMSVYSHRGLSD